MTQIARSAACNRLHSVEQRASRWILQTHDRVEADAFDLRAEFLAQMLGEPDGAVRRRRASLRGLGAIAYDGEAVEVRDRSALEQHELRVLRASCATSTSGCLRRSRAAEPTPVPSLRAPSQAPRGRDRRQDALALQSGQGPLSPRGLHEGPGDRLLHADRAGPAAAPARPSAHLEALSQRRGGQVLLREALPVARAVVGADRGRLVRAQRGQHHVLPLPGPADARVAGQPRRPRAAHAAGARAGHEASDDRGLRPRPGAAGDDRRVRAGGAGAAAGVRVLGPDGVPEDVGLEGDAGLSAAEYRRHLRGDAGVLERAGAAAGAARPRAAWCRR